MLPHDFDKAAHIVQQALTPVFLLSGIAALLNVFVTRLARVVDQLDSLSCQVTDGAQKVRAVALQRRLRVLDWAVVLATSAGGFTCASVLALFLGEAGGAFGASILFFVFSGAIILTMGALAAFAAEMILATRSVALWRRAKP